MYKRQDQDLVTVELQHVDGTQNALYRKECIDWLKEDTSENVCRILSNARCLSEGIDVPALDAVMFLNQMCIRDRDIRRVLLEPHTVSKV